MWAESTFREKLGSFEKKKIGLQQTGECIIKYSRRKGEREEYPQSINSIYKPRWIALITRIWVRLLIMNLRKGFQPSPFQSRTKSVN